MTITQSGIIARSEIEADSQLCDRLEAKGDQAKANLVDFLRFVGQVARGAMIGGR